MLKFFAFARNRWAVDNGGTKRLIDILAVSIPGKSTVTIWILFLSDELNNYGYSSFSRRAP